MPKTGPRGRLLLDRLNQRYAKPGPAARALGVPVEWVRMWRHRKKVPPDQWGRVEDHLGGSAQAVQSGGKEPAMDASRLKDLREKTERLFELTTKGNEMALLHWTILEHQIRTWLRDAEREG